MTNEPHHVIDDAVRIEPAQPALHAARTHAQGTRACARTHTRVRTRKHTHSRARTQTQTHTQGQTERPTDEHMHAL
eukprot:6206131-Pleurochrysis_carterae.AAC.3